MAGISYSTLVTMIRSYTEVDDTVFTTDILENFILNAQHRISSDVPVDSDRVEYEGTLAADVNTVRVPTGMLFVRGVQVFNSTSSRTGQSTWLQKRDRTFINEYVGKLTGPEGSQTGQDVTALPKYYAMFGGTTTMTGVTDSSSGTIMFAPCPDKTYSFQVNFSKRPPGLTGSNTTTYLSMNFPNGLLYACLVEAFGYLKGPMDMLTYYEQRYNNEIEKFAMEQIGRRRRDDYDDGTLRLYIDSPSPSK